MGRWSRPLAAAFLAWFAVPAGGRWLDAGCGTGALTEAVLNATDPVEVVGIDPYASPRHAGSSALVVKAKPGPQGMGVD